VLTYYVIPFVRILSYESLSSSSVHVHLKNLTSYKFQGRKETCKKYTSGPIHCEVVLYVAENCTKEYGKTAAAQERIKLSIK